MVRRTIRFKQIRWDDRFMITHKDERPVYPGVDGAVEYEITVARTEQELRDLAAKGDIYLNPWQFTVFQPFKRGTSYQQSDGENVWSWDGNKESPTLNPSWLMDDPHNGFRIHLYFTDGRINLLGDSTVELIQ